MRALRGGQLHFVISLLKVINGEAMQVSLAGLLTAFIATQPGSLGVSRRKTGLGTCLDLCKTALGGRDASRLKRLTALARPCTYILHFRGRSLLT